MPSTTSKPHQPDASHPSWARWLFVLILLGLGVALVLVGAKAVREHHYAFEWRSRTPVSEANGVKTYNGGEAVLMGTGFMAFGAMLATWGAALVLSFGGHSRFLRVLGWFSFACLLAAMVCIYPPWKREDIPFFAAVVLVDAFFFTVPDAHHQSLGRIFFPLLIISILGAALLNIDTGASMAIGLFVALGILAHLVTLFPRLQGRVFPETR